MSDTPFLNDNPREKARHYIPASDKDIQAMLEAVGVPDLAGLYKHIDKSVFFDGSLNVPEELGYEEAMDYLLDVSLKNTHGLDSYIGDGLPDFRQHEIVEFVCGIRNLTTAYTPYQPERSQGTLLTHWIYQCLMTRLTGFEAVNSSLYDRSTALFEGICAAIRLSRKADTALVSEGIYPGDREVLETLVADTTLKLEWVPLDPATGRTCQQTLQDKAAALGPRLAAVAFPQVNSLGLLEDVNTLTDAIHAAGALAIAVIDPLLLATGGLKRPSDFGQDGADIIVGEAQHLALEPNFGGPGLGLFGVRHNDKTKNHIRATPGRFVGKALDEAGRECCVMVLSTREQHIRKDKATSNICSNQAFLATLVGAALLAKGESGTAESVKAARENALLFAREIGAKLAFPETPFFNEVTFEVDDVDAFLAEAREEKILAGVDVSDRIGGGRQLIKASFSDQQALEMVYVLLRQFDEGLEGPVPEVPAALLRAEPAALPEFDPEEVAAYYLKLGELNVSPDDGCYPLGSCTMKYNPWLNDWAAARTCFTQAHPQAPEADVQGCLEVLYETQEWFKGITGLPGVTTQPVAGAQGELVGVKLFQAYHRDRGETHRDVILIPKSAHGTNFATAAMAGLDARKEHGVLRGIVLLEASEDGLIDMADFDAKIAEYGSRLCGVMITNPNTCGLFETRFREVADKVHAAGGLVYMDGANMNAIAGWLDLDKLGVDAVHNNLHKTWTIPHGGGGPGDAIVAVSDKLVDFLPGRQVEKLPDGTFRSFKTPKSIGSFHRHWGNFAHKIRAYAYLLRLGKEGIPKMSAMAVLSARYLFAKLRKEYPTLPQTDEPRMHEFILTLEEEDFARIEAAGVPRALAISRVGKLFLDYGFHAPTVAWPETFGLMIEPTESYTQAELDRFAEAVARIRQTIKETPEVLASVPHFTPVDRIDDVTANRSLQLFESLEKLPPLNPNRLSPAELGQLPVDEIAARITAACAG